MPRGGSIDAQTATRARARNYLLLACGTGVALTFGVHAVAPALPLVQQIFDLTDFEVGLVSSAYVLPGVLVAVPLGIWADLVGRRYVFAGSAILYGIAGVLQGLAPSFEWLLLWRLLQGLAFAAIMPLTVTILGDAFRGLAQVRAQAQRQVSMAVADLLVPIVGAQLAALAWYLPFGVQGITVLPGLLAIWVLRPAALSRREARSSGYLRLAAQSLRRRGFPSVLSLGFVRFFARFTVITFLPLHLTRELDASLSVVGLVLGIASGLGFLSAMLASRLAARARPSRIVLVAVLTVGCALLAFASLPSLWIALATAVAFAAGDGLIGVLQSSYAARGAPESVRAGLVAVNGTARNAGKLVAPLSIGAVASFAGVTVGFLVAGGVVIAAMLAVKGLAALDETLQETDSEYVT